LADWNGKEKIADASNLGLLQQGIGLQQDHIGLS